MATLSTVAVDFVANTAQFSSGLDKINKQTLKFSNGIKKDLLGASKALGALGAAALVAGAAIYSGIAAGVGKSIQEISDLKDEADKVGASAAGFMKLSAAAEEAGSSAESLKKGMVELTKSIGEAQVCSTAATVAFAKLGIDADKLAKLNTDDAIMATFEALNNVTDATERARLGTVLLGKQYTELAILGKNIGNINVPIGQALSNEDINNIKAAGEAFEKFKSSIQGAFNLLAAGFAPALKTLFEAASASMQAFLSDSDKVRSALSALSTPILVVVSIFDGLNSVVKAGTFFILKIGQTSAEILANMANNLIDVIELWVDLINKVTNYGQALAGVEQKDLINKNFIKVMREAVKEPAEILKAAADAAQKEMLDALPGAPGSYTSKVNDFLSTGIAGVTGTIDKLNAASKSTATTTQLLGSVTDTTGKGMMNLRDSILASVDASAKYRVEVEKINKQAKEANLSEADRLKLIAGLSQEYLNAVDASSKYADQVARINEDKTLTEDQKRDSIRNLAGAYMDILDPLSKFKAMQIDLQGLMKNNIITQTEYNRVLKETAAQDRINRSTQQQNALGQFADPFAVAKNTGEQKKLDLEKAFPDGTKLDELTEKSIMFQKTWIDFAANNPFSAEIFTNFTTSLGDGFTDAIMGAQSFRDAFHSIAKSVLRDIVSMIVKQLILNAIMGIFSGGTSVAAKGIGGAAIGDFGKAFNPSSFGGIAGNGANANAGQSFIVGDKGPELFMAKQQGTIFPNDMLTSGGGEAVNVYQTINVQTGVAQTVRAEMIGLLPLFKQQAIAGVMETKRRGGPAAAAI